MVKTYSDKEVTVIDWGLFLPVAQRLASDFKKVNYHVPRESGFPTANRYKIGDGLDGITRVDEDDLWKAIDRSDLIVFPDVGDGGLQEYLRKHGKKVFGTGRGENLELDRQWFREGLKKLGLPVIPYRVVKGIDSLRKVFREEKDKWVKISTFRGLGETFHHQDYTKSLPWIDSITHKSGPYQQYMEFLVEDSMPGVEVGSDWFFTNGQYLNKGMYGIEVKDKGYICKVIDHDKLPKKIQEVDSKMAPVMKSLGVMGAISTEVRIGKDGKPYFIDSCQRFGSPPGETITEMYSNFSELVWGCANGEAVEPKPIAKYGAQIVLYSEFAIKEWCPVDIPKEIEHRVKLRNLCKIRGQNYIIPQDDNNAIGSALGFGKTLEEAQVNALETAERVEAEGVYFFDNTFEKADAYLEDAKKFGVGFD